jgi:hypothetical protein
VPSAIGGGSCPNMTCTAPISLLSFEAQMRDWFTGLVENAGGDAIAIQAQLQTIGLPAGAHTRPLFGSTYAVSVG